MALKGVRVIEMAGLAPAPFCGMILNHFGAKVIRVDKLSGADVDRLAHGKASIAVNMKKPAGVELVSRLVSQADVLLEPFRAGVMEKLGLGPDVLMQRNPRLVYARLTGYGQDGPMAMRAGHDINYIATTGVLSLLGRRADKPHFPLNLLADFGGGGLMCALGIVMALYERSLSGQGQVIDANMVEGASYLSSFLRNSLKADFLWPEPGQRGSNLLDGGAHFYDTYETSDGKFMAIGAIEPQFYDLLLKGLKLSHEEAPQFGDFSKVKQKFTQVFKTKTQTEWCQIFDDVDACVTPVLTMDEAVSHPHNVASRSFMTDEEGEAHACPAPRLSRTPGVATVHPLPRRGQHTLEILQSSGFTQAEIRQLQKNNVIVQCDTPSKL